MQEIVVGVVVAAAVALPSTVVVVKMSCSYLMKIFAHRCLHRTHDHRNYLSMGRGHDSTMNLGMLTENQKVHHFDSDLMLISSH